MGMEPLVASTRSFSAQKIGTRRYELLIKVAKGGVSLLALVTLGLMLGTPSAEASETTGEHVQKSSSWLNRSISFTLSTGPTDRAVRTAIHSVIALRKVPIEVRVSRGVLTLWSTSGRSTA